MIHDIHLKKLIYAWIYFEFNVIQIPVTEYLGPFGILNSDRYFDKNSLRIVIWIHWMGNEWVHKLNYSNESHESFGFFACSSPSTWDTPCKINFFDVSDDLDKKKKNKILVQKEGEIFHFFFKLRMWGNCPTRLECRKTASPI